MIEGWSVEQADLTLLADVVTSATKVASTLIKGEDITLKQFLDLLGALGNMLGLPVKNLIREVGGLIRMAKMVFIDDIVVNDAEDLLTSFWRGGVMSSLVGELTESEKLYDALRDHDEARLDYYKKDFEKRDVSYDTKVKRAIKEQYVKGNISANQAKNDLAEYLDYDLKKDKDELFWILRQWTYDKDKDADDEDYQKYGDFYAAVESGKNLRKTIKFYTDNGVEESTLAANITSKYRPLYKEMSNRERVAIKGYLLNAYVMLGYDRAEKSKDIDAWLKKEAK